MLERHSRQGLVSENMQSSENLYSCPKRPLLQKLLSVNQAARELFDVSHQIQTRNYNDHRRSLELAISDLVWVIIIISDSQRFQSPLF